jgi:hypothetical protein
MLDDAYQNPCDRFVVVSGDSDLVSALNLVKTRFPENEFIVYVPSRSAIRVQLWSWALRPTRIAPCPWRCFATASSQPTLRTAPGGR